MHHYGHRSESQRGEGMATVPLWGLNVEGLTPEARRLKTLRLQAGLTQKALAARAGVSPAFVGAIEQCRLARSELAAALARLAPALGVPVEALTGGDANQPPRRRRA